ncbi:MAG: ABC transporter ATP-binding protein [Pseudomonadota bacterium]
MTEQTAASAQGVGPGERLVELSAVSKIYPPDPRPVLDQLDLSLSAGESLALVGRSGSGKTTLLNLIAGLLKPDAGHVRVAGHQLATLDENALAQFRRQQLGIVFQSFNLLPTLTVRENLAFPLALSGLPDDGRSSELLDALGIAALRDKLPEDLSGGEQQRVAVARALIHQPQLVLADEPTGNLDLDNAHQVIELLVNQCRERGAGLLLITHSSELSARMDRTLSISEGRLLPSEPTNNSARVLSA